MSFASIYFIFIFLPVVCLLYYLVPKGNWRNVLLVLASLAFFAWVEFENLHLLLLFILVNYLVGLLIDFFQVREQPAGSRWVMWAALVLNLGFLGFYKYLGLFDQLLPWLASMEIAFEKPPLILGLSYLTFSSLSYILDIYHGVKAPEKNIFKFSAYLVMFPKLIQGPIVLYKDLAPQLNSPTAKLDDIAWGI
jgi:alginate O-acetyltransferase complex protein AlgI